MVGRSRWVAIAVTLWVLAGCQAPSQVVSPPASSGVTASLTGTPPPSPAPGVSQPVASVPPISTTAWTRLAFVQLAGQPEMSMVVPWSGGYVALGQTDPNGPSRAWTSSDGRTWTELPDPTFGLDDPTNTFVIGGTACGSGVLIVSEDATGRGTLWASQDGRTWNSQPVPGKAFDQVRQAFIAGGPEGVVLASDSGPALEFSPDCQAWQTVSLAGPQTVAISAVAPVAGGFVALDDSSHAPGQQPRAWWSADGLNWTGATVEASAGDDFSSVLVGDNGILAGSHAGGVPGLESQWTSVDGHAWALSRADPFGLRASGEGTGDPAGWFAGDGTRLIGWGAQADSGDAPDEYWTSTDAQHWTKLAVGGNGPTGLPGARQVFLMRDGILVSGEAGSWFGQASSH